MRDYVAAKIGEFSRKLAYAREALTDLSVGREHQALFVELHSVCDEIEELLRLTRALQALDLPQLFRRQQVTLARIRQRLELLEESYLPALRHEGLEELRVSHIISRLLQELQISWMADKVVSFHRSLSMYPGIMKCPIFYMPRYTRRNFLDWLGLYHEIGHTVYQQFPEIGSRLSEAVFAYCQEQLRQAPALTTSQLNRRTERFRQTLLYWNNFRLEELFCDIFASMVAGPAYLFSWVDVSLTSLSGPYEIDLNDEHPPNAARTQACMLALHDNFADEPLKLASHDLWERFLDRRVRPPLFNQMCPFPLILAVVRAAQDESALRGFPFYSKPLISPPQSLAFEGTENLQELVNIAMVNCLFASERFSEWQDMIGERLYPTQGGA